ncbi:TIGR04197 family type VII secretion effector [Carnobacterium divergens]|uniref:TIGR04197 family type VII secretion effector n=1 Tax=Carnobacterium divergens TaxID=2748 RepID=A0AAW8RCN0_CARDV|nr:TIGR04197 family type VII secretion effector [Carnobacterium divergens]MDT1957738.1 TIGR04197 family type VII secretion effector [Carnobacterium divergens]MDT1973366.1 TIGR04197 family type VII secretion effector [Carnobacterium divergens]
MGKTGVDKAAWDSVVSKADSAVSSISKPTINELGKTTLNRFKKVIETQRKLVNTVESFKNVSKTDTQKMKQVAENIVSEDNQASKAIQQNTTKVRFK